MKSSATSNTSNTAARPAQHQAGGDKPNNMEKNNPRRMATALCNAKNALARAVFELDQASLEGAAIPKEWLKIISDIRDKIKW